MAGVPGAENWQKSSLAVTESFRALLFLLVLIMTVSRVHYAVLRVHYALLTDDHDHRPRKSVVPNLWYARAFYVVREYFRGYERLLVIFYSTKMFTA